MSRRGSRRGPVSATERLIQVIFAVGSAFLVCVPVIVIILGAAMIFVPDIDPVASKWIMGLCAAFPVVFFGLVGLSNWLDR